MSQFVVSARKYRPQRFDEVVGQEHVSKTLKNALQNDQLAHAFLFCGPRGVGKTTCARILAKVLNCENRTADFEACGECNSCEAFMGNASFNINELDAASNNSVEHIRALIEQVRFQPQQGQYKIFIIDEVHMLSQQAFNAFLKTLEEPPPYAIFILATTEKHKIIPTILSRCQIFDFKRIQVPRTVAHLQHICQQEGIEAEKEALHIIAQKSDGALRDALSIFDRMNSSVGGTITYNSVIENLNVLDYDYYFKVADAMATEDLASVLVIFDEIFKKGFEPDIFITGLAEHLRNLLVCKDAKTLQLLEISDTLKSRYQEQSNLVPSSFILTALNIAADCDINYKMARHKRLHVEMAIIKMTYIGRAIELSNNPMPIATKTIPEKKKLDLSGPVPIIEQVETKNTEESQEAIPLNKPYTPAKDSESESPILEEPANVSINKTDITPSPTSTESTSLTGSKPMLEEEKRTIEQNTVTVKEEEQQTSEQITAPATKPLHAKNGSLKRAKSSKFDMPSLTNIIEIEEEAPKILKEVLLEKAPLMAAWEQYINQIESPSVKQAFKGAKVQVKDEVTILLEVGSQMAKQMIQQEGELVPFLREALAIPKIALETTIDLEKAKELVVTKKILSTREKYELMRSKNPFVQDLTIRLGLKPDND